MLTRLLTFVGRHGAPVLACGVFAGLIWPELAHWFRPLLVPAVFIVVTLAMIRLDWTAMAAYGRRPLMTGAVLAWLVIACPLLMWAAVTVAEPPQALGTALILKVMSPPVIASVAIALLLGLDAALAIVVTVAAMFLVPLTLPPAALALLGLEIDIGLTDFMLRLALLVGGGGLLATIVRRLAPPEWLRERATQIDGCAVMFFLVFGVAIMDGVTATLVERPAFFALYVGAAFVANLVFQVFGVGAFWWLGRQQALTIGLASGNRNLALLMAVLVDSAEFDVLLFFAVGQLPIYILPAALAPAYRRLLRV